MTAVIVQCRISSTRLPGKALKDLGGKPVLAWTLNAMRKVPADAYYVATDEASFGELAPVAASCGWEIFAGPLEDVLKRFCLLIDKINADVVVRATADNPFLFYEAAVALLDEYKRRISFSKCDYITWTGLPHGSGVEVFDAHALIEAEKLTSVPYDREHVGPALYNHRNRFSALMLKAPSRFYFPELRTTIDTASDYRRALTVVQHLSRGAAPCEPYPVEHIVSAFNSPGVMQSVLYVPSVKAGRGMGHLQRCIEAATETGASVYIPEDADLPSCEQLVSRSSLAQWQIVRTQPQKNEYALIVADCFSLERETAAALHDCAPLVALDEGSPYTNYCDYLLDIIPSNLSRAANCTAPEYISLPQKKRSTRQCKTRSDIRNVLVCFGGEDPEKLTIPAVLACADGTRSVVAVVPEHCREEFPARNGVQYVGAVPLLREQLFQYDIVITHYGLTAYEAASAGCGVVLVATTPLHASLAKKYGFVCLQKNELTSARMQEIFVTPQKLYRDSTTYSEIARGEKTLGSYIASLAGSMRLPCPLCNVDDAEKSAIVARTPFRTFRQCNSCGMIYMSWTAAEKTTDYGTSYFAEEYKNQYGKTYLEDFDAIKAHGKRRMREIDALVKNKKHVAAKPVLLDVGCAYGPFLAAASDDGWQVFGTDISEEAVAYVQSTLLFPAAHAQFPAFNAAQEFGMYEFDAVTMWYVIEHFRELASVLAAVSKLVKVGGVFAFSTPSGEGVSAKMHAQRFYNQSPSDHYTIWEPSKTRSILKQFGFTVEKIVSTGHHPERFPQAEKKHWKKDSFMYKLYERKSRLLKLGDTFEVYCKKINRF